MGCRAGQLRSLIAGIGNNANATPFMPAIGASNVTIRGPEAYRMRVALMVSWGLPARARDDNA
jgi:hypothetical protein